MLLTYNEYNRGLGYVQGMSDLLAPIYAVMQDDAVAFWGFVGFMKRMVRPELAHGIVDFIDIHIFTGAELLTRPIWHASSASYSRPSCPTHGSGTLSSFAIRRIHQLLFLLSYAPRLVQT